MSDTGNDPAPRQPEAEPVAELKGAQLFVTSEGRDLLRETGSSRRQTQTDDQALWVLIRNQTNAIGFNQYNDFISRVLCGERDGGNNGSGNTASGSTLTRQRDHYNLGLVDAYNLLKTATEAFLLVNCCGGVTNESGQRIDAGGYAIDSRTYSEIQEEGRLGDRVSFTEISQRLVNYLGTGRLPYIDRIVDALDITVVNSPFCKGAVGAELSPCLLELIWSYWQEEGMLVQATNAISLRFQNRRISPEHDALSGLTLDPLRPLSNILWGFVQDEIHRLTIPRRAYEYDHEYGLTLVGKAVPKLQSADSRTKFVEQFHNLLSDALVFYREQADRNYDPDAFPLLNSLRELHLLLTMGMHNQFGDLPWTARVEMLIMQWLLSRTEMREFLGGRPMVAYPEPWMGQIDAIKKLMRWDDTSTIHYHNLATFGEQLLLSLRYGDWSSINDSNNAVNWATYWRPEIQGYVHAYRAVTGVDLGSEAVNTQPVGDRYLPPAVHIQRRQNRQMSGGSVSPSIPASIPAPPQAALPVNVAVSVNGNGRGNGNSVARS